MRSFGFSRKSGDSCLRPVIRGGGSITLFIIAPSIEGLPLRFCDSACEKILFGITFQVVSKSLTQMRKDAEIQTKTGDAHKND